MQRVLCSKGAFSNGIENSVGIERSIRFWAEVNFCLFVCLFLRPHVNESDCLLFTYIEVKSYRRRVPTKHVMAGGQVATMKKGSLFYFYFLILWHIVRVNIFACKLSIAIHLFYFHQPIFYISFLLQSGLGESHTSLKRFNILFYLKCKID